jgi:hypothetical protein
MNDVISTSLELVPNANTGMPHLPVTGIPDERPVHRSSARMAGHSNATTTGLYHGRNDDVSLGALERIRIERGNKSTGA